MDTHAGTNLDLDVGLKAKTPPPTKHCQEKETRLKSYSKTPGITWAIRYIPESKGIWPELRCPPQAPNLGRYVTKREQYLRVTNGL